MTIDPGLPWELATDYYVLIDAGAIEDTVELNYPCTTFGIYGGVVDSNNDFWITRLFEGNPGALRIDHDTLTHDEAPSFYG